jgi:hypothetical protein
MRRDPIIDEVRQSREAIAREYGDDLETIAAAFQQQDAASAVKTVSLRPKRLLKPAMRRKTVKPRWPNKAVQPSSRARRKAKSRKRSRAARG